MRSPALSRRTFLGGAAALSAGLLTYGWLRGGGVPVRRYGDVEIERSAPDPDAPNILMLVLDDQNDWLGFLDAHPGAVTPNLDRLAARSMVFERAYCPAPLCRPSRSAVLFGRPPQVTGLYDHSDESRPAVRELDQRPSLLDDLWAAGYATFGSGKVFGTPADAARFEEYQRTSFYPAPGIDARHAAERDPTWVDPYSGEPHGDGTRRFRGIDFGPSGRTPEEQPDTVSCDFAVEVLGRTHERPFFLAVGMIPPHEPWRVPQEFFDLHPIDEVVVPAYFDGDLDDVGPTAGQLAASPGDFERIRDAGLLPQAVQAYQAATSYVDWCHGRVLDELAAGPHGENTVVVLWSDHGFHLGQKLHFHKLTLWEPATRVPFLIADPRDDGFAGTFAEPVSTLDLGPTLAARCGFEIHGPHDGADLQPLLDDPGRAAERPPLMTCREGNHAVRRDQWRYIRYASGEEELYDLDADPDEFDNLAPDPQHRRLKDELAAFLPS